MALFEILGHFGQDWMEVERFGVEQDQWNRQFGVGWGGWNRRLPLAPNCHTWPQPSMPCPKSSFLPNPTWQTLLGILPFTQHLNPTLTAAAAFSPTPNPGTPPVLLPIPDQLTWYLIVPDIVGQGPPQPQLFYHHLDSGERNDSVGHIIIVGDLLYLFPVICDYYYYPPQWLTQPPVCDLIIVGPIPHWQTNPLPPLLALCHLGLLTLEWLAWWPIIVIVRPATQENLTPDPSQAD